MGDRRTQWFRAAAVAVALGAVCACSGSGGTASTVTVPAPTATPSPSPSPPAGDADLDAAELVVPDHGRGSAQTFTASEAGFSGSFTATTAPAGTANSCSGIATISPASGSGSFSVTPVANGHCTFTISDGTRSATETIDVTTTTAGGS